MSYPSRSKTNYGNHRRSRSFGKGKGKHKEIIAIKATGPDGDFTVFKNFESDEKAKQLQRNLEMQPKAWIKVEPVTSEDRLREIREVERPKIDAALFITTTNSLTPCKFCGATGINPSNMKKCIDCHGKKYTSIPQIILPKNIKNVHHFKGDEENPIYNTAVSKALEESVQILKKAGIELDKGDIVEGAFDVSMHGAGPPSTVGGAITAINKEIVKLIMEND